jgi:hypothetical protein
MQTAEQTDQERLLPATFPSRAIAWSTIFGARSPGCNGAFGMMLGHIRLLHPLIKKRKHNQPFGIEPVLGA